MRRRIRPVIVLTTLFALNVGVLGPAAAHADPPARTAVSGFDAASWNPADIVQGRNASILVRWVAGEDLTDGTVEVDLPAQEWQTPLHPAGVLNPEFVEPGSAVVRPSGEAPSSDPAACPWPGDMPEVEQNDTAQIVRATHVTCAAGQYLDFRVLDVRAPDHRGQHYLQTQAWGADAGWAERLPFPVMGTPDVSLHVTTPRVVQQGQWFAIRIIAMRGGAVATDYRGSVAVTGIGSTAECGDESGVNPLHTFTAEDGGSAVVSVFAYGAHRFKVRDVGNQALPGRSNLFGLRYVDPPDPLHCPVSYH